METNNTEKNDIEKVYDQIHASESLKQETFKKIKKQNPKKKTNFRFVLSMAAMFVIVFTFEIIYHSNKEVKEEILIDNSEEIAFEVEDADLNHFQTIQELRDYFDKNYDGTLYYNTGIMAKSMATTELETAEESILDDATTAEYDTNSEASAASSENLNYYQTNTQVENVDEADIVKTDGEYIYYITNSNLYIVKGDDLSLITELDFTYDNNNERYSASELFIKDDKLVVIGSYIKYETEESENSLIEKIVMQNINTTKVFIYDISDKSSPKELRQVDIDGNYNTSRLIGNTLYFVSTKYMYYYPELKDDELLPIYYDSAFSSKYCSIDCKNIVYNENSTDSQYQIIGAVKIDSTDSELVTETFLGYGETIYCSENNLYIATSMYNEESKEVLNSTEIYKFNISSGGLKYSCKTIIDGDLNNQFSLDEYDGNLRVATTVEIEEEPLKTTEENDNYVVMEVGKTTTNNIVYVLDENLEQIGKLTDFGIEEEIYSVRFIKNVAYIVTFEEIDPLFVIDLSDPTNPTIKGELEIPGYSSYLHPYDETHIIGIGYNVKNNGYGGVTNETVKVSMFDVSDLSNPKEVFSKTLGEGYSYTNVVNDHKLLMYDSQRNLMGFPITIKDSDRRI